MKIYLLLDRSGSMSSRWSEAINSINTYAKQVGVPEASIYVAAFDDHSYDVMRDTPLGLWKDISTRELEPRGMTPLYDSFSRMATEAELRNDPTTVLVVMTDGQENCSKEHTKTSVQAKVADLEARKWPVIFLGADFTNVSHVAVNTMSFESKNNAYTRNATKGRMGVSMNYLAQQTMDYSATGQASSFVFNEEEEKKHSA